MIISIINHTNGQLSDEAVQSAIRAINRQIAEDFSPYWGMSAKLRLEGKSGTKPDAQRASDMRGDAVLYLWNEVDVPGALGYHEHNNAGIPYGFVFTELAEEVHETWTVTLSHEALEMIADPEANLLVKGPHPADPTRDVFHWYEMCDAVQAETYDIDGVAVSNFVLPLYFTGGDEAAGRNDFLGTQHAGTTLTSFGVNPGGYVGFYDATIPDYDTFTRPNDREAKRRLDVKSRAKEARRAVRYREPSGIQRAAMAGATRR
jgi:hypothetical protein